jgi:hypothetical protein
MHASPTNHDFLAAFVGIKIEKQIFNREYVDRELTLSFKASWECQAIQSRSNPIVTFDSNLGISEFYPNLGFLPRLLPRLPSKFPKSSMSTGESPAPTSQGSTRAFLSTIPHWALSLPSRMLPIERGTALSLFLFSLFDVVL